MREILFRGKTYDGKWEQGDLRHGGYVHNDSETYIMRADYALHNIPIDPKTIGQYTGLTDKNGTKIFEGDILESPIGRKAVVSFGTYKPWSTKDSDDFECWKLTLIANNEGETKLECGLGKHCTEYMKVIGNIHDNPELLKEREG